MLDFFKFSLIAFSFHSIIIDYLVNLLWCENFKIMERKMAFAYNEATNVDRMIYRANISRWIFFPNIVWILFSVSILTIGIKWDLVALAWIASLILVLALFGLIKNIIYVISTELYITQKFTIAKSGLIRRDTLEVLNHKIESIGVKQTILGRILNYGDLLIVGTGSSLSTIKFISMPLEFRRQLLYVQESNKNANKG